VAPGHRGIKTALSAVSGWPRRPPGGRACSDGRGMHVNYPSLKGGACTGNLMETTTMQFNSPEGCFIQPYSCRPVDTASTDYPWNHGITGYLYRSPRHTSYALQISEIRYQSRNQIQWLSSLPVHCKTLYSCIFYRLWLSISWTGCQKAV